MKKIVLTVTNDLDYDQRMIRICQSLSAAGYDITLIGAFFRGSSPLQSKPFRQKRFRVWFQKGKFFYLEFNLRLFFYLLFVRTDIICAIDLDTILPCYWISKLRGIKRVYDAHELFCEMQEIVTRPFIYRIWKRIERHTVPGFHKGYTVNQPIAAEFQRMYAVNYEVIRNMPVLQPILSVSSANRYFLYQGAVNEGRSFETLIPAMKWVNAPLWICGDGNFMQQARKLVAEYGLESRVLFKGKLLPAELRKVTEEAWAGITLFEKTGPSNFLSLANRYFDYLHAGIPQICVDYPVYHELNSQYEVALLTGDLSAENLASEMNRLLGDELLYNRIRQQCLKAREVWNWQQEEKKLIAFYQQVGES